MESRLALANDKDNISIWLTCACLDNKLSIFLECILKVTDMETKTTLFHTNSITWTHADINSVHTSSQTCVCVYVCLVNIRAHNHTHTRIYIHPRAHFSAHKHKHARAHARTHTHTHVHTRAHTHARTHTRAHTHTQTHARSHTHTHRPPTCCVRLLSQQHYSSKQIATCTACRRLILKFKTDSSKTMSHLYKLNAPVVFW